MAVNRPRFWLVWGVGLSLVLGACSGPRGAGGPREAPEPEPPAETRVNHADYEAFDPAPYEDEAPATQTEVQHDVPERLMSGHAGATASRTMQGYRVQVFQALDKSAADAQWEQAIAWWREQQEANTAPNLFGSGQPPIYVSYRQPYYRVRLGNFATREAAQAALRRIQVRFPGASIVPDTVTVAP